MFGLHPIDLGVIGCYLLAMVGIGWWATRKIKTEEDFFMGSRSFGKLRSLFVSFGMATSSETAVSTAREAYREGFAGVWVSLFVLFVTPFYWILAPWYRRVRMISTSDFLRARFESRGLEVLYAMISLIYFMCLIAAGLLALQKTVEVLLPKPVSAYTAEDHQRVTAFERLHELTALSQAQTLDEAQMRELAHLRSLYQAGQAVSPSSISLVNPVVLQLVIAGVVVVYSLAGGLLAAAATDMIQGILMLVMCVLMLPMGLSQIGGFSGLHDAVPAEMFQVFGSPLASEYPWHYVVALTLLGLAGTPGSANNFSTMGGASKDELSARIGTTYGAFLKRFTIVMWGFTGVIGWGLFHTQVSDADMIWGYMTHALLGPGFIGLMIVCLLAAVMSSADAFMIAAGALASRNLFAQFVPNASETMRVLVGRLAAFGVMAGAVVICLAYNDMLELLKFMWPIPLCFGPVIWLGLMWRRTNKLAAWAAVAYSLVTAFGLANLAEYSPTIAQSDYFTRTVLTTSEHGTDKPIFFEKLTLVDATDPDSGMRGEGRFKVSLLWLAGVGVPLEKLTFAQLNSLGFLLDATVPFLIVIGGSYIGRSNDPAKLDRFYATFHTPIHPDPTLDRAAVEASIADPSRFESQKMFPGTKIELLRPRAIDIVGFLVACGMVIAVIALLVGVATLRWP